MVKRFRRRSLVAALVLIAPAASRGEEGPTPAGGGPYAAKVVVEADRPLHAISPFIYGASAVDPKAARAPPASPPSRWGGNRSSRYNWKARADNAGSDWFFLNGKAGTAGTTSSRATAGRGWPAT